MNRDYAVRAVRCDHRAGDEEVYEALKRATDRLTGAWEKLEKAGRIALKFNMAHTKVEKLRGTPQGAGGRRRLPRGAAPSPGAHLGEPGGQRHPRTRGRRADHPLPQLRAAPRRIRRRVRRVEPASLRRVRGAGGRLHVPALHPQPLLLRGGRGDLGGQDEEPPLHGRDPVHEEPLRSHADDPAPRGACAPTSTTPSGSPTCCPTWRASPTPASTSSTPSPASGAASGAARGACATP